MLDHICINAPFESSFFSVDSEGRYFFVDVDLHSIEIPLASRSVHKNDDGSISAAALFHPYESVPTHYTVYTVVAFDTGGCIAQDTVSANVIDNYEAFLNEVLNYETN